MKIDHEFSVDVNWKIGCQSNQITLTESSSRGFSDPIYNNMNTLNTELLEL